MIERAPARIVVLISLPAIALTGYVTLVESAQDRSSRNAIGMQFVTVAAGEFMMGCSTTDEQCQPDEKPRHRVQITKGFEIGKHEVTQAQWIAVMGNNPSSNWGERGLRRNAELLRARLDFARISTDRTFALSLG